MLSHKQRIEKAHIALFRNPETVWLAPVCLVGNVIIDTDMPTAATDGRNVWYGASFLDKLNDAQVRSTVVHENLHKAMLHLVRHEYLVEKYALIYGVHQARMLVNMAQDFVINREIKKLAPFCQMWDGILDYCYDKKYDDEKEWDTARIAKDLHQNSKKITGGQDGHDWESAKKLSEEEKAENNAQIEQALRQGVAMARKMSAKTPRVIDALLEPAVDWQQALRDFVTARVKGGEFASFSRPNRKYVGYGLYMPSTFTEVVESVSFMVDTSGSINDEVLREVLSELRGCIEVVRPEKVDIMYWDTEVVRHEHYYKTDADSILRSSKPQGGGGTAPSCVTKYCRQNNIRPTVAVWLSDGFVGGDWAEELGCPALWIITSEGQKPQHLNSIQLPRRTGA